MYVWYGNGIYGNENVQSTYGKYKCIRTKCVRYIIC